MEALKGAVQPLADKDKQKISFLERTAPQKLDRKNLTFGVSTKEKGDFCV